MSNLRAAAQQALEALECGDTVFYPQTKIAIAAIRAALAEPEFPIGQATTDVGVPVYVVKKAEPVKEPVAYRFQSPATETWLLGLEPPVGSRWDVEPLYTAPPQRKPMTEDEIELAYRHIYRNLPYEFDHSTPSWVEQGIRYAERAHGIGDSDA